MAWTPPFQPRRAGVGAHAVHSLREVAGQASNPALLFSDGKDSIVLSHLSTKAFRPARLPFPLLHIDTERNRAAHARGNDRRLSGGT